MSFGITLAVATVGSAVAGSVIQGNATAKAQKKGAALQQSGLDALTRAEDETVGSDAYKAFTEMLTRLGQNPQTYSPADVANMKTRAAEEAFGEARSYQNAAWERAGAQGAYRDSSTRAGEARIGQALGGRLADINRQVDQDVARQRIADIAQFGSLLQGFFNLRQRSAESFANAAIGAGTQQAGYNASPFGDALKGIGLIGTSIGTAKKSDGSTAFGDLFG